MSEHPAFSAGSLIRARVDGEVDFVVIGGLAAQAHGSPLITEDLDPHGLARSAATTAPDQRRSARSR